MKQIISLTLYNVIWRLTVTTRTWVTKWRHTSFDYSDYIQYIPAPGDHNLTN